ncbi:MAG: response regulator transcription factor [Bacteroidales bacterium]|nr:response regulator transcription factor [Bacteroidales bacterium]MCF8405604.1 response regulator transcription factor [Bacteroidales bacterium]
MKKTVLILDDKHEIRNLLNMYLSKDYNVVAFPNGLEAINWLQEGNIPDGIISDINMPEVDGREFLGMIKTSGAFKTIPIIMLSSIQNSDERIKLLDMGANDYMIKPFNPAELKVRLAKIINN